MSLRFDGFYICFEGYDESLPLNINPFIFRFYVNGRVAFLQPYFQPSIFTKNTLCESYRDEIQMGTDLGALYYQFGSYVIEDDNKIKIKIVLVDDNNKKNRLDESIWSLFGNIKQDCLDLADANIQGIIDRYLLFEFVEFNDEHDKGWK